MHFHVLELCHFHLTFSKHDRSHPAIHKQPHVSDGVNQAVPAPQRAECESSGFIRLNRGCVLWLPPPPHAASDTLLFFPDDQLRCHNSLSQSDLWLAGTGRPCRWPLLGRRPPADYAETSRVLMLMLCLSESAVPMVTLPSSMRPRCCWSTRAWSRGTHLPSSKATVKSLCCISLLTSKTAAWSWEPGPTMETSLSLIQ